MAINRYEFHPALRAHSDEWLTPRATSLNFRYPMEEQIAWYGDIQLRCRKEDYQHVLDTIPGAHTVGTGLDRKTNPNWDGLMEYRARVQAWAAGFDDQGNPIKLAEPAITVTIGNEQQAPAPSTKAAPATGVPKPAPASDTSAAGAPWAGSPPSSAPAAHTAPVPRSLFQRIKAWFARLFG